MTKLLAMLAILASLQGSTTPVSPVPSEPRQLADDAMKFVAAEDMKGLFAFVAAHMPTDRESLEKTLDSSLEQRKKVSAALGKSLGTVFVRECRFSNVLVRVMYLEKREKNALRWQFIFYKARTAWAMSSFNWDDNLNPVFAPCD